jgi:DNA polymerase
MESAIDWHATKAMLEWQLEMGVDETILGQPLDRFAIEAAAREAAQAQSGRTATAPAAPTAPHPVEQVDPVAVAQAAARSATDLDALRAALGAYEHCDLRKGARNLVFSDGVGGAPVMIVGEAPGRDEDREGRPFVGRAGQLLDRMLDAIGLSRTESVYITNVLPWRPPQNRDPLPAEIAMMQPFLRRHIALANPRLLVIMGNPACKALLGRTGITRLRGQWTEAEGLPAIPMLHPAYLLRNPGAKREAWADLLALKARLRNG